MWINILLMFSDASRNNKPYKSPLQWFIEYLVISLVKLGNSSYNINFPSVHVAYLECLCGVVVSDHESSDHWLVWVCGVVVIVTMNPQTTG